MTDKIKEAAKKWFLFTAKRPLSYQRAFEAGATSEAAREYWEGQKDEEIARLTQKVEFYRQTTDKVRELIFSRNDIGQPCQPLYDGIYDKITSQDSEIARLKEGLDASREDEAIRFVEWIDKNEWMRMLPENTWVKGEEDANDVDSENDYTTEQLYQLYKKQNP